MKLTTTDLEKIGWACQGWIGVHNENMERLNDKYLKLSGLQDVNIPSLNDNDVLVYNSATSHWINHSYGFLTTTTS